VLTSLGVKAIGVVSSFAAIGDFSTPADQQDGKVYTENDWLPWTDEYAETIKAYVVCSEEKNGPDM
jgi:hypothetical protein